MKGRYCAAIVFTAVALLCASISGYSIGLNAPKSSVNHAKRRAQQAAHPDSGGTYVVQPGDSLFWIARSFNTTPEALMSVNKLQSAKIKIGWELTIPGKQNPGAKAGPLKTAEAAPAANGTGLSPGLSQEGQDPGANAGDEPMRLRLVKAGFEWIGVRYRPSGGSEQSGFDCSGLVKSLFSKFNIELPRSSREQFKQGEKVDRDKLEAGDLVFFSKGGNLPTHVGIYVGNDQFLHAAEKARQVIVSDLNKFWSTMRYLGARRITDLWGEEPAANPGKN